jgi:hypothetical protein
VIQPDERRALLELLINYPDARESLARLLEREDLRSDAANPHPLRYVSGLLTIRSDLAPRVAEAFRHTAELEPEVFFTVWRMLIARELSATAPRRHGPVLEEVVTRSIEFCEHLRRYSPLEAFDMQQRDKIEVILERSTRPGDDLKMVRKGELAQISSTVTKAELEELYAEAKCLLDHHVGRLLAGRHGPKHVKYGVLDALSIFPGAPSRVKGIPTTVRSFR